MQHVEPNVVFALAFGAGVLAQVAAAHLRVPSIVLLFALGIALGPDGIGWVTPSALGEGLFGIVGLAVAVILFEGGLNLDVRQLRRQALAIRRLVTLGVLVTAAGGAVAARVVLDWPWRPCILFGTIVVVTGPTVVRPILRHVPLRPRLATVLEAEGVLTDPIGAILAAVALQVVVPAESGWVSTGLTGVIMRLGFGALAGLVFGLVLGRVLRMPRLVPEELANIVTLGLVLVLFEACELVLSESGVLAVTVAGVAVANMKTRISDDLREFKEHLTVGLVGLLFILLAADVRLSELRDVGWAGVATVAVLSFVVRPACVAVGTFGANLSLLEKLFLCWLAPRGIVAAAVASLSAAFMDATDVPGGSDLRALVFLTIGLTVVVQGGAAPIIARLLRVRIPGRETVAILGAEELGLALAEVLRDADRQVVLIDVNPTYVRAAQERGFNVVYGNALEERTLIQAHLEQVELAVALTANEEVNSLFAREAMERFSVPRTLVAVRRTESGVTRRLLEKQGTGVLFDRPKDVERWNVRFRHTDVRLARFRYVPPPESAADTEREGGAGAEPAVPGAKIDPHVILVVQRNGKLSVMSRDFEPQEGDVAIAAIYVPDEDVAIEQLREQGWEALPEARVAETGAPAVAGEPQHEAG